ncbi:MAG: efflux transporter outer membrane subunit [Alphaproteobacteria bacterium]|nr:efflux transporter outer membrane subunit [Alphaproteobacteria bacterium]
MPKSPVIWLGCLLCLACTVGPDYEAPRLFAEENVRPEDLSRKYKITQNWYRRFDDAQLNDLIEQGLRENADIKQAAAKLKQARAILHMNKADFLPQIGAQGGYDYEKYSRNIGPAADADYYSAGFDASWEIDFWGKGRRQSEADAAELKAAEFSLDNMKTLISAEIAAQYVSLLQNTENLRLARQNLQLQQQIYDSVLRKYQNGLTDAADYHQARYLVATTQAQIPLYENNIEAYKNALSVICGRLPDAFFVQAKKRENLFAKTKIFYDNQLMDLPLQIVRLRPDVAADEQKLIAQNALVGKAVAELYPDISVSGLWGYAAHKTDHLFNSSSQGYQYAPAFSVPLLDWNKIHHNIELQKYMREEQLEAYRQTVLQAAAELQNSMVSFSLTKRQFEQHSRALKNMKEAVDASMRQYQNGLIDFAKVLQIQQNYVGAQNDYLAAKAQVFHAIIAYYKAAGGGRY